MTDNTEISEIELSQESNADTQDTQETLNSEYNIVEFNDISGKPKGIPEPETDDLVYRWEEPKPQPWDDAPEGVWFYDRQYDDGHFANMTQSAERAYKRGWDLNNNISIEDVEVSDINGFYYPKDKCPHKTQEMIDRDNAIQEINQLKKQLADSDYKAIKYAEGELTEEEYAPTRSLRSSYRLRINELQDTYGI